MHIVENVKQDELSKFRFYVTGARPDAVIENQLLMDALLTKGGDADLIVMDESLSHADMKVAIFDPFSKLHKDIISTFDE